MFGHDNVAVLDGGLPAYRSAGYALESSPLGAEEDKRQLAAVDAVVRHYSDDGQQVGTLSSPLLSGLSFLLHAPLLSSPLLSSPLLSSVPALFAPISTMNTLKVLTMTVVLCRVIRRHLDMDFFLSIA